MCQKICFIFALILILSILSACVGSSKPLPTAPLPDLPALSIARHPSPADYSFYNNQNPTLPAKFDPDSSNFFQNDYRSTNLSALDLTHSLDGLLTSDFDTKTVWPSTKKLPAGFDIQKIMEFGKDPGLGIRHLHAQGITGSGVGIAIIDQPMLVDHQEYATRLRLYEEINVAPNEHSAMHGPAVASIAVGKTVGVAP
jgi:hypothetical protein